VNLMFQSYALFPHLTVAGNVAYGLQQERLPRTEIAARVAEMLALVQMEAKAARKPHQLSGGERQRVALARALAKRPRVLLLDEPLGALDRRLREATRHELKAIQARLGATFIVVTHDQEEALGLADRVAVMREGRIVQAAPPRQIYEAPVDRWTARFLGEINLFEGRMAGGRFLAPPWPNGVAAAAPPDAGDVVWLGVRPEKVRVSVASSPACALPCTVTELGYLGDRTTCRLALESGETILAVIANSGRAGPAFGRGDRVFAGFDDDDAMVLGR
jgi:putrescine transport system ATP-binding protein